MTENRPEDKKKTEKKEPIDSIEETVEELRKKIAELDEEEKSAKAEKEAEDKDHSLLSDEQKQKVTELKDSAVKTVNDSIDQIKQKANDIKDSASLDKTVAYIKEHAVNAADTAKQKIDDIKNDPRVSEAGIKASEKLKEAAGNAQSFYEDHVSEQTRENISQGVNKAAGYVKEGTRKAVQNVDAFVNRPDVQEKIGSIKKDTADLLKKGSDFVSSLRDKANKTTKE